MLLVHIHYFNMYVTIPCISESPLCPTRYMKITKLKQGSSVCSSGYRIRNFGHDHQKMLFQKCYGPLKTLCMSHSTLGLPCLALWTFGCWAAPSPCSETSLVLAVADLHSLPSSLISTCFMLRLLGLLGFTLPLVQIHSRKSSLSPKSQRLKKKKRRRIITTSALGCLRIKTRSVVSEKVVFKSLIFHL